jgi:cytochrome P450
MRRDARTEPHQPTAREDGAVVDMQPLFFNFTIDNSTEFLLGRSINFQTDPAMTHFSDAWDYAEACLPDRVRLGKLVWLARNRKFEDSCDLAHRFVDQYIAEWTSSTPHAGEKQGSGDDGKPGRYNLLSELSSAFSDRAQLRNELLNVLLAARDTTAALLSSTFYFLARHPAVWDELAAEVAVPEGQAPNYATLKGMRVLKSILDETLRLHPPVPVIMRFANRHTTLPVGGGPNGTKPVFVAKGTVINYSPWTMRRLPEVYGPDAEGFRPGRWLDRNKPLRPGWAYLPFNGGPRVCLGQQSALVEASYVVVRLVQHLARVEPRGGVFREHLSLTLSHFDGVKVALWKRGE